jgi:predicted nucleic acid-binding protein
MLEILPGFWQRAGATRASLLAKGIAAKLPDTLIAQSCIDHNVPLITRDTDFRHFAKHCGLKLA